MLAHLDQWVRDSATFLLLFLYSSLFVSSFSLAFPLPVAEVLKYGKFSNHFHQFFQYKSNFHVRERQGKKKTSRTPTFFSSSLISVC